MLGTFTVCFWFPHGLACWPFNFSCLHSANAVSVISFSFSKHCIATFHQLCLTPLFVGGGMLYLKKWSSTVILVVFMTGQVRGEHVWCLPCLFRSAIMYSFIFWQEANSGTVKLEISLVFFKVINAIPKNRAYWIHFFKQVSRWLRLKLEIYKCIRVIKYWKLSPMPCSTGKNIRLECISSPFKKYFCRLEQNNFSLGLSKVLTIRSHSFSDSF